MIKRGNSLNSSLIYSSSSPSLILPSQFPQYQLSPQYQSIANRIQRLKVEQKKRKQKEEIVYNDERKDGRNVMLEDEQKEREKFVELEITGLKYSRKEEIKQSQQVLHNSMRSFYPSHTQHRVPRRSVQLSSTTTSLRPSTIIPKNPELPITTTVPLIRSSSLGRLKKQSSSLSLHFPQSLPYNNFSITPISHQPKSSTFSCTEIDGEERGRENQEKESYGEKQRKGVQFLRRPLVAGRIYCKEDIMRESVRDREREGGNRIKRMPIQNLMNVRR